MTTQTLAIDDQYVLNYCTKALARADLSLLSSADASARSSESIRFASA